MAVTKKPVSAPPITSPKEWILALRRLSATSAARQNVDPITKLLLNVKRMEVHTEKRPPSVR